MIITDTLNGHTVEDIRRNPDGSVTFFCDSGRTLTLHVSGGQIVALPKSIIVPGKPEPEPLPSQRMRLLQAFQGQKINYVTYTRDGGLSFTCSPRCAPVPVTREVRVTHSNGLIEELPPVSARVQLTPQSISGGFG